MQTLIVLNDTISSSVFNDTDVTATDYVSSPSVTEEPWGGRGCRQDGGGCRVKETARDAGLCQRLAPPPVPPWLRDSPGRLHQMTRHCRSWTLYHELCISDSKNLTQLNPRDGHTTEDDGEVRMELAAGSGIQWVIPALALVVLLLLLLLALVLYKYYSRPHKKSVYRVSGSGYRLKPPETGSSWGRGPLVESETSDSYLSQPADGAGPDFRHTRSPVCRLLEQTQYVATPTEDQYRSRPVGPPAFTSPAYFLPALSWLRLPLLRQAWPGQSSGTARDTTQYSAATPIHCDLGESTTHHWQNRDEDQWAGSKTDEDPEYSEIWDKPPQYSTLTDGQATTANGIGPYEYEMEERNSGRQVCQYEPHQNHSHRPQSGHGVGKKEHRYEKLWPTKNKEDSCPEGEDSSSPSHAGTCENGWLARYRLPSPCVLASQPPSTMEQVGKDRVTELVQPVETAGLVHDDLTSDTELLPSECFSTNDKSFRVNMSDRDFLTAHQDRRAIGSKDNIKQVNASYEGVGKHGLHETDNYSPLSKLWGYIGWNKR